MCGLVMLSSIGESNWEWQLQLAHSKLFIMFQITWGPKGALKYWVLCSWLLNRESSCDWIFETTTTPQVVAVGAHCKFSCAISEPAHDCKLQQSQIRSLIAEIHKHWHSPPPPHLSTTYIYAMDFYFNCSISPLFVRLVVVLRRFLKSNYEAPAPVLISEVPCSCHKLKSRNPQSYRLELISR